MNNRSFILMLLLLLLLSSNIFLHHQVNAQQQPEHQQQPSGLPDYPAQSDTVSSFQPSLAVVVGVLAIMFTLTFTLLAYAKCCHNNNNINTRTASRTRRSIIRRLFTDHNDNPGMIFNSPAPTVGRYSSGIDKTIIESLPFFRFSSLKGSKEGLECSVCLSRFEDVEVLRLLPKCKHGFHIDCIDRWLDHHSTCPLCRQKVSADDLGLFRMDSTNSLRLNQSDRHVVPPPPIGADHEENNGFEVFVEREEEEENHEEGLGVRGLSLSSCASMRFGLGNSFRKLLSKGNNYSYREGDGEIKEDEMPISGGARGTYGDSLMTEEEFEDEDQRRMFHKFNHKIIVSDVVFKNRWSNVSSSDLLFLNSEMLNDMSSARFLSSTTKHEENEDHQEYSMMNQNHQINDHRIIVMNNIKEEMERKRNFEARVQIMPQTSTSTVTTTSNYNNIGISIESEKMMKNKYVKNDQKRSMSEITGLDRFKKQDFRLKNNNIAAAGNNSSNTNSRHALEQEQAAVEEEKKRRIWFPIAKRTVQWFVNRENYRTSHSHLRQTQQQGNNRAQILDV